MMTEQRGDRTIMECYEETIKEDLVRGFVGLFDWLQAGALKVREARAKTLTEHVRVADLLARDAAARTHEDRRRIAEHEIDHGRFVNIADAVMQPTPELLRSGVFEPYTPKGKDGTVRSVQTVRRQLRITQIEYLHRRGVLDDDLFGACRWYKDRYEAAEMEPSAPVASYGETVRGDPCYGHMPRSAWGAEARSDYRLAQGKIPLDVRDIFNAIVLKDMTFTDATRTARCGFINVKAAFLRGALSLHGGIAHRLEIEPRRNNMSSTHDGA